MKVLEVFCDRGFGHEGGIYILEWAYASQDDYQLVFWTYYWFGVIGFALDLYWGDWEAGFALEQESLVLEVALLVFVLDDAISE